MPLSTLPLVDIVHPNIRCALAYATTENFTGQVLYPSATALLRPEAAKALYSAADAADKLGVTLVLLDAYRPVWVQKALWAVRPDPKYVADPAIGSDHSRGTAVDLTLAKGETLLDMGTAFDAAVVQSHHSCLDLPQEALANRATLKTLMTQAGFLLNPLEWWHYALPARPEFVLL